MLSLIAASLSDLDRIANQIIQHFPDKKIFALHGEMGAGKTTLIKSLCQVLGVFDVVLSPTFSLINEYRDAHGQPVYHFDFYRINNVTEAYDMGYEEYLYSGNYCFVEWPEKIGQLLPDGCVYIDISFSEADLVRTIGIHNQVSKS